MVKNFTSSKMHSKEFLKMIIHLQLDMGHSQSVSANWWYNCSRTTEVTWTAELHEKFENAIFGRIFQIPAIE